MTICTIRDHKQLILASAIALAQLVTLLPMAANAAGYAVRLAGQSVFAIPAGSGKLTAQQRATFAQRNLDNALVASEDKSPAAVRVIYVKGVPVITLGGYQVVTVDALSARMEKTTPASLARRWSDSLRFALGDPVAINDYVAQLMGGQSTANLPAPSETRNTQVRTGHIVYLPAGMVLPVTLTTGISSEVAQPGDRIEATVSESVTLENGAIPAGTVVIGQVAESEAGRRMGRSGELNLKFTSLRTPDGSEAPIAAHIIGSVGKYSRVGGEGSDMLKGETTKNKVESAAIRGAIGAGSGALLGTAIGAIAGHGHGAGRGAWSGAAIGGALGVADALLLRRGADVRLKSGEQLQLQLDTPAQITLTGTGAM